MANFIHKICVLAMLYMMYWLAVIRSRWSSIVMPDLFLTQIQAMVVSYCVYDVATALERKRLGVFLYPQKTEEHSEL